MSILEQYRKGSYKGVEFDTFSLDRKKTKKYTTHEYSNSSRRYIEQRGVTESDFSVTLSIFGKDDYISKRDAMRKALDDEGEGLLVLPLEGEFNVKCIEYSDSQDLLDSLGRCDFTATFSVVSQNETSGNPVVVKNAKISLANTVKSFRNRLAEIINGSMVITNATSYAKTLNKMNSFLGRMTTIANRVGNGSFSNFLTSFATSLPNFLGGNISLLGSAIGQLFYTFESAYSSASDLLSSSETLFAFGDTDTPVTPNTPQRIEQIQNAQVLNTQIKASALGVACNAFAQNDFANELELQEAQKNIEKQINDIITSDIMKNTSVDGVADIKYYLKQIQVDFADVVAEKYQITPKIKEINVRNESVSLIAYKYYDSLDDVDALIDLNNISNPKSVSGNMRIFVDE